jgi:hypothetical protein
MELITISDLCSENFIHVADKPMYNPTLLDTTTTEIMETTEITCSYKILLDTIKILSELNVCHYVIQQLSQTT